MMSSQVMRVRYEEAGDVQAAGAAQRPLGLCWALLAVALVGLGMAGYLTLSALGRGTIAGCGAGSACDMAMSSAWAWWLGVPVSGLAVGVYGLLLVATLMAMFAPSRAQPYVWTVLPALALMLVGAAAWFFYVLLVRIGAMCPWCTVSHLIGLVTAGLIVMGAAAFRDPRADKRLVGPAAHWSLAVVLAATGLAALIGGQILRPTATYAMVDASALGRHPQNQAASAPEDHHDGRDHDHDHHDHPAAPGDGNELLSTTGDFYREVDGSRMVAPAFTDIVLDPYKLPMIGSPDARHLLLFFFDYTCGSCRQTHRLLRYAHQQFGDQIGVVLVNFPVSGACNPMYAEQGLLESSDMPCKFARLGLALWRVSPDVFTQFDNWMLNFQAAPPLDVGVKKAIELAGREKLEAALADPWVEQQLQQFMQFGRPVMEYFQRTPVVLMGHQFMQGIPDDAEAFCRILKDQLGVAPGSD